MGLLPINQSSRHSILPQLRFSITNELPQNTRTGLLFIVTPIANNMIDVRARYASDLVRSI